MLVLALAAALLWRVYLHHTSAEPYTEEPTVVRLDESGPAPVKFTQIRQVNG